LVPNNRSFRKLEDAKAVKFARIALVSVDIPVVGIEQEIADVEKSLWPKRSPHLG
jgi:hypothetical protein